MCKTWFVTDKRRFILDIVVVIVVLVSKFHQHEFSSTRKVSDPKRLKGDRNFGVYSGPELPNS